MPTVRTRNVPLAATVIAVLLGLFALVLGTRALVDPSAALGYVPGADVLGVGWGGRNAGLGVALLVAVAIRRPSAYVVAFAAQVPREIADLVNAVPSPTGIVVVLVFLAIDLLGLGLGARALRQERASARA